jgi:hypothetical protein
LSDPVEKPALPESLERISVNGADRKVAQLKERSEARIKVKQ